MYCIDCGKQIPEVSKYCIYCGKKQQLEEPSIIAKKTDEPISRSNGFIRKALSWYFAWIVLNLCVLLIFSDSIAGVDQAHNGGIYSGEMNKFWPFCTYCYIRSYDYREFFVYVISPLPIIVIWNMIKNRSK